MPWTMDYLSLPTRRPVAAAASAHLGKTVWVGADTWAMGRGQAELKNEAPHVPPTPSLHAFALSKGAFGSSTEELLLREKSHVLINRSDL